MQHLYDYAEELMRLGRPEMALAEYGELIDACLGGAEPLIRRGLLLGSLGRFDEARADLEQAAEVDPKTGWALLRLGQMVHARGKPWLAAAYVAEAAERQPDMPEICIEAAKMFAALDWLDRAYAVVRPLPVELAYDWGDLRRATEARYRDHRAETRRMLRQRRGAPLEDQAAGALSLALFRLGRLRMARRLCELVMRRRPESFPAFGFYARILARERGPAEAASFLRAVTFLHGGGAEHTSALAFMVDQLAP